MNAASVTLDSQLASQSKLLSYTRNQHKAQQKKTNTLRNTMHDKTTLLEPLRCQLQQLRGEYDACMKQSTHTRSVYAALLSLQITLNGVEQGVMVEPEKDAEFTHGRYNDDTMEYSLHV